MKKTTKLIILLSIGLPSISNIGVQVASAAVPVVKPRAGLVMIQYLRSQNFIISESKAKNLTEKNLSDLMKVTGEDLSDLKLESMNLDQIHAGLNGKESLDVKITWAANKETVNAHLIILPDEAVITEDGQKAINAYDATIRKNVANPMGASKDKKLLDEYTKAKSFYSDGRIVEADLNNALSEFEFLKKVPGYATHTIRYNFSSTDKKLYKEITLNITNGSLKMTSVPSQMDFGKSGKLEVQATDLLASPNFDQDIIITDSRQGPDNTGWKLLVKETQPLVQVDNRGNIIKNGHSLYGTLKYSKDGQSSTMLSSNDLLIQNQPAVVDEKVYMINQEWNKDSKKGIYLDVPPTQQYVAKYTGQLTWTLSDVPMNVQS